MRLSRPATVALGVVLAAPAPAQAPQPQAAAQQERQAAAQQERMKACNAEAGQKKLSGDTRKSFMAACLAGKPAASATPLTPTSAKPAATAIEPAQAGLIDINSASKDQLEALPQIGSARAEAIIKGRPYKAKNDLVDRYIVPPNAYKAIQRKIFARPKS